jgi:hypothetical protein
MGREIMRLRLPAGGAVLISWAESRRPARSAIAIWGRCNNFASQNVCCEVRAWPGGEVAAQPSAELKERFRALATAQLPRLYGLAAPVGVRRDAWAAQGAGQVISCAEAVGQLWEYLDGVVGQASGAAIEGHLSLCRRCCGEAEFAAELRSFLAVHAGDDMPGDVHARLLAALGQIVERP